jgi:hypothetical protein
MMYIRGKFSATAGILNRSEPNDDDWKQMKFVVFDAPMLTLPFEQRVAVTTIKTTIIIMMVLSHIPILMGE